MDAWKKQKLPKVGKKWFKLSFFLWSTHRWNGLCETDWLEVSKDIREILKFYKNQLRLVTSWFIGNVRVKPYFNTQWGGITPLAFLLPVPLQGLSARFIRPQAEQHIQRYEFSVFYSHKNIICQWRIWPEKKNVYFIDKKSQCELEKNTRTTEVNRALTNKT